MRGFLQREDHDAMCETFPALSAETLSSEISFFFDDDIVLNDKNILAEHLAFHQKHIDHFACGGFYKSNSDSGLFSKIYLIRQQHWLSEAYLDTQKQSVGYLLGGHFSIKRKLLQQFGLSFDAKIKFGSSETEFFLAAGVKKLKLSLR